MDILRGNTVIATMHPNDDSIYSCKLMGDNIVKLNFKLAVAVTLAFGDYIMWGGQTFTLNTEYTVKETSTREYEYNCEFQSIVYDLLKAGYKLFDNTPVPPQGDFSLTGNALTFLQLLVANLNRNGSGWTVGECIDSDFKTLDFSGVNCSQVLTQLSTEYETEFYISATKVVNLRKKPFTGTVITLAYGMGNGLKWLQRIKRDEDPIITCLFAYGAAKNLPIGYRGGAKRLMLPGDGYLLDNVLLYGVREGDKIFETIYPRLIAGGSTDPGKVTAVNGNLRFTDINLDFDVNEYRSTDTTKVVFNTGELAGYEFEVASFDNATKTYTIITSTIDGMTLPSDTMFPAIGDQYVLTNMYMPEAYVTRAELELAEAALEYIEEYSAARDAFKGESDTLHFKNNNITLDVAQVVRIQSTALNIDREIRVISYTQNINQTYKYDNIEFAEKPAPGKIEKLTNTINNNTLAITSTQKLNWTTTLELLALIKGAKTPADFSELTGLPMTNDALAAYLARIGDNPYVDTETKLISGAIIWKSGLTYNATDINYKILGVKFSAQAKEITLADADPNLSRIDTFFVDVFGNLQVATGTPAVNPTSPILTSTQLEVMTVFLSPGALTPSNVDVDKIYDENTGWATSKFEDANTSIHFESTDSPLSGTKRIKVSIAIPASEIPSPLHYIGERYQGGIIFWLSADGKRGLICAITDTANGVFWASLSGGGQSTGGRGVAIGTGQANTLTMLAQGKTLGHAVKYCNELIVDGYSDWFMPSQDELLAMYFRRFEIGGFANKSYWSSTEANYQDGIAVSFANGVADNWDKNNSMDVRAIRFFDDTILPAGSIFSYTPKNLAGVFTAPGPVATSGGILSLNIKSSIAWQANSIVLIETYLGAIKTGSVAISPTTNLFGYKPDSAEWQLIAIQMYNFAPSLATFDSYRISLVGSWPNGIDLGFDDIRYQHSNISGADGVISPGNYGETTKGLIITYNAQGKATKVEVIDNVPADETITAAKLAPDMVTTLAELAVDKVDPVPATTNGYSGTVIKLTAAVNLAFGDVCFINANGKAAIASAATEASATGVIMCVEPALAANLEGTFMLYGIARKDTWNWTVGGGSGLIYLSITGTSGNTLAQTVVSAEDQVSQILGFATHATRIFFNPSLIQTVYKA